MFTHQEIWYAIDWLARKRGLSTSGLAKKAGLDPTSFNKSKRFSTEEKPRWPSTETIAKILSVSGMDASDLFKKSIEDESSPYYADRNDLVDEGAMLTPPEPVGKTAREERPAKIPLIEWRTAFSSQKNELFGDDGMPENPEDCEQWGEMLFPLPRLAYRRAERTSKLLYACRIDDDSLQPVYRNGDVLILSPYVDIKRGDRVVIRPGKEHYSLAGTGLYVGELIRNTASRIEIISLHNQNPRGSVSPGRPKDNTPDISAHLTFLKSDIEWISRVCWVGH